MLTMRQRWLTKPILRQLKQVLPPMSDTELQALEAGGVWWDAQLLSGKPDWQQLLSMGAPQLSSEERAFIDGPVATLCEMIDDWAITFEHRKIPTAIWDFLKQHKFFGMIIPKQYGGLEFSAYAHSEIVTRISTVSTTVAVTVMVPNSLGPGELLHQFGTQAQRDYYLPRLADGREIPCFGLTSPEAGSDAASMVDKGVVCYGEYNGEQVLGMRVNWHKRYITLGPVATLLGLAFKLYDPDHLIGEDDELGITVALVPTDTEGVIIGDRHYPCMQAFQNGPNWGEDVFVPMDWVIGGQERIGEGWKMLMAALAAGRSISLPSLSTGGAKLAAKATGAYARIREQFNIPIGNFEGVRAQLANIAATTYLLDAARKTTTQALDHGHIPVVISAILKAHATYRLREVINDAMDVHGGKAISDGPNNYLGNVYRSVPVAITVEGANTLTRNLIIFGQGAIRCHPYLLAEMDAASLDDEEQALHALDRVLFKHAAFICCGLGRVWLHTWTAGHLVKEPKGAGSLKRHYQQISRYSAVLTFISEVALITLGGALKRKEYLSARLGDVLSELYLLSCVMKNFEDDGRPASDRPLIDWLLAAGLNKIEQQLDQVISNFPSRPVAWLMKLIILPLGIRRRPATDALTDRCAELLLEPSDCRRRLTEGVHIGQSAKGLGRIEDAFDKVVASQALRDILKENRVTVDQALQQNLLSESDAKQLHDAEMAVALAVAVDHFGAEELTNGD
ncbi:acyl-CoA dehydrogenase [Oceanicoccus sp. KOV_DT_Chl]|uniref:acyl-CoA dehydrogenase n=1 Tax=Oceanicoccus sp. KOV_DT_Chl TaxID=1904639 RepID=UPI000C7C95D3|nr:acyl-CoA dehydrogenase [Oceanicoccus sp. KOV_DT_Chl]